MLRFLFPKPSRKELLAENAWLKETVERYHALAVGAFEANKKLAGGR